MIRRTALVLSLMALAAPLAAQAPAGWLLRMDRGNQSVQDPDNATDVKFVQMGAAGMHVTAGPAAIYWNPANTISGNYTVKATFSQMKNPAHPEAYGLFIGGGDLGGDAQNYIYFLVRPGGEFLVKHRSGTATHNVQEWKANAAVVKPDDAGKATNSLEVRVGATEIAFAVNGTVVHTAPKTGMTARTDGIAGIRINHNLDVHIEGFGVAK